MHNVDLILTLTGGLAAALVLGYVTHLLGLSPIVGYLLAGIAVGPYTPGFVADQRLAEQMAEIGVILLMFGVGLHFRLDELLAVRRVAVPGAILQSLLATGLGAVVAHLFGWTWTAGIVFGLAISVASTVVLLRVLTDNRDLHTPTGHIALGWLVVEDLFTVLVLVLLPTFVSTRDTPSANVLLVVLMAVGKIGLLVAFTFLVGDRVIPWLLERAAKTRSRELFTLTVLVVALGIAVGSAKLFGASMALGAFLAGMVVGRSDFSLRAASEALPMRDAFAVLFFVSVGMLFDPRQVLETPALLAATCGVVFVGKPLAAVAIVLVLRYPLKVALLVAVALAQVGEFSFILAALGKELEIFTGVAGAATNVLVAAAIISITLNPVLYRIVRPAEKWLSRLLPVHRQGSRRGITGQDAEDESTSIRHRHSAIVVGYGPVGQTVTRLLRENDIEPRVVELNLETVRTLRDSGIDAVYGDASRRDTLVMAGVEEARSMVLSAAGMRDSEEVIRLARELNPNIHVLARTSYLRESAALRRAGADDVFSAEGEVALALIEAVLRQLGATGEQVERERERFRTEVLKRPPAADGLDSSREPNGE